MQALLHCIIDFLTFLTDGCRTKLIHGIKINPLLNQWSWSSCTAIFYGLHAIKQKKADV